MLRRRGCEAPAHSDWQLHEAWGLLDCARGSGRRTTFHGWAFMNVQGSSGAPRSYNVWAILAASAVGTMIEWYDFYIFGSLATVMAPLFYPKENETLALIAYLATFAVGFVVRPFGALFFGRIGDLVGRK